MISIKGKSSGYQQQGRFMRTLKEKEIRRRSSTPHSLLCFQALPTHPYPKFSKEDRDHVSAPQTEKRGPEKLPDFSKVTSSVHGKTLSRTYWLNTTKVKTQGM